MDEKLILDYDSGQIIARLDRGEKPLVQNVRIRLPAARRLALIGETGSGKTMIARRMPTILFTCSSADIAARRHSSEIYRRV